MERYLVIGNTVISISRNGLKFSLRSKFRGRGVLKRNKKESAWLLKTVKKIIEK